jgi:hypothetical protein
VVLPRRQLGDDEAMRLPPPVSPDAGSRLAVDDKKPSPAGHGLPAVTALRLHTVSRRTTDDARRWVKEQLTVCEPLPVLAPGSMLPRLVLMLACPRRV